MHVFELYLYCRVGEEVSVCVLLARVDVQMDTSMLRVIAILCRLATLSLAQLAIFPSLTSPQLLQGLAVKPKASPSTSPTLVVYAYSELSPAHRANGAYFLRFGVDPDDGHRVMTVFVANGPHTLDAEVDSARSASPSLIVLERDNSCFDFGAWSAGLRAAGGRGGFDYFVFLNASVRGPLSIAGRSSKGHWADAFLRW